MRAADVPRLYNASDILDRNLSERAGKPALFSAERELTFAEAAEDNQLGHALRRLGVRPGETVGLLCLDCAEWVTAFFGIVKIGGIWVSPVELESTLLGHPAVLECAVVGRPDSAQPVKPEALGVLHEGYAASDGLGQDLIAYCRERLAEYKRPRWVRFVAELPKTATGKIQRFKMRAGRAEV